jgi:uncharacterized protein (TIGR02757 family)
MNIERGRRRYQSAAPFVSSSGDHETMSTFPPGRKQDLKSLLDSLYRKYHAEYLIMDPLEIVRRYHDPQDQEVVAFIAAALAIGRVEMLKRAIEEVLQSMKISPFQFVRSFDPIKDGKKFEGFKYRFYRASDIGLLMWWMHQMVDSRGSIEKFFLQEYHPGDPHIGPSLSRFVQAVLKFPVRPFFLRLPDRGAGIRHYLADPEYGSGCKRLNLFLRWMVRDDGLDLGLWKSVKASQLIIPLDTHVVRMGRCLGLTQRKSPDWKMAVEITESLRAMDPEDPVKYDIALCRLGKLYACPAEPNPVTCGHCPAHRNCLRVSTSVH